MTRFETFGDAHRRPEPVLELMLAIGIPVGGQSSGTMKTSLSRRLPSGYAEALDGFTARTGQSAFSRMV